MGKILEKTVKDYLIFVDTSSLMAGQKNFFFLDLLDLLNKYNKKICVVSNIKNELLKNKSFAEKKSLAEEGLAILEHYKKHGLLEDIACNNDNHAEYEIIQKIFDKSNDNNICLFTEDKNLAKDILVNVKKKNNTTSNNDIQCIKIVDGSPVVWDAEQLLGNSKLSKDSGHKDLSNTKKEKLLINIVIDNSASMKGSKIQKIKQSLLDFHNNLENAKLLSCVEYSITVFSGFNCSIVKQYDESVLSIDKISAGGIPFVDLSITKSLNNLEDRIKHLTKSGFQYHKPWLLLLLNGENFGDVDNSVELIKKMYSDNKLTYFPYALSDNEFDSSLNKLKHLKKNILVKDEMYDSLFKWVFDLAKKRVETPIDQSISIDPNSYDGWIIK